MQIRPFGAGDEEQVIALWERCGLVEPHNNPQLDIERKQRDGAELFLVGEWGGSIIAVAMGGYDGHRGWVNYLAADPDYRDQQLGYVVDPVTSLGKRLIKD